MKTFSLGVWQFLLSLWRLRLKILIAKDGQWLLPGYEINLPRDHLPHYQFRTEWWYFTGNLKTADGRAFGYQLTFFAMVIVRQESGSRLLRDLS